MPNLTSLTVSDRRQLARCEKTIERGMGSFIEVGQALLEIRDRSYYRDDYGTFEEYCKEKWGFARNYANQLIAAARTVEALGTNVPKPTNEAQARELNRLPAEQQPEAWQEVVEKAGGSEKVTTAKVREAVERRRQPESEEEAEPTIRKPKTDKGYIKQLVLALRECWAGWSELDAATFRAYAMTAIEEVTA